MAPDVSPNTFIFPLLISTRVLTAVELGVMHSRTIVLPSAPPKFTYLFVVKVITSGSFLKGVPVTTKLVVDVGVPIEPPVIVPPFNVELVPETLNVEILVLTHPIAIS